MKTYLMAAALAGTALMMGLPASALTVDAGAGVTRDAATNIAWYCKPNGNCVQGPRQGYMVRNGWDPACRPGWAWNGWKCARMGPVVYAAPPVVYAAPPVVYAPGPVYVAPGVKVRPNGTVVIRP